MKLKKYIIAISFFALLSMAPIPAKWNVVIDKYGALVEDKIWYVCVYAMLTTAFHLIYKLTNHLFFIALFLLSIGKLIDQFFNPYGYHAAEIIWDAIIFIFILTKLIHGKKP